MATGGLTRWFKEQWVDISRPKEGGGFEPCGRKDADEGKYPKCVPASRAAKMTEAEIKSAVSRKRRAESTERREGKKPINVKTKVEKKNVPTNPKLYAEVKAAAKRKFDVYPSAYANGWLVQEYKRRGGKYKTVAKGSVGLAKHVEHDQSTHGRRKTAGSALSDAVVAWVGAGQGGPIGDDIKAVVTGRADSVAPEYRDEARKYASALKDALKDAPKTDYYLHRGLRRRMQWEAGDEITLPLESATPDWNLAHDYARDFESYNRPTAMVRFQPGAPYIDGSGYRAGGQEGITGGKFKVVKVDRGMTLNSDVYPLYVLEYVGEGDVSKHVEHNQKTHGRRSSSFSERMAGISPNRPPTPKPSATEAIRNGWVESSDEYGKMASVRGVTAYHISGGKQYEYKITARAVQDEDGTMWEADALGLNHDREGGNSGSASSLGEAKKAVEEWASSFVSGDVSKHLAGSPSDHDQSTHGRGNTADSSTDYRMQHRPSLRGEYGAPAHNLTDLYPEDVYSRKGVQYYGTGAGTTESFDPDAPELRGGGTVDIDREVWGQLIRMRGNPDAEVSIYRAVPLDGYDRIQRGDWVAITPEYAREHGESSLRGNFKIIEATVRAGDIFTSGDSWQEWGWDAEDTDEDWAGRVIAVAEESVSKHVEHDQSTHGRRKTALPGVDWDEFKTPPDELRRLRAKRWPGDILDTEEDGVSVEASIDEVVEHYELIVGSGHENLDGDTVARTPDGDYIALHSEDGKVSVAKTYRYFDEVADDVDLTEMAEEIHRDWQRQAAQGVAYHGTSAKNLESIRRDGLETRRITRGLSNKGVGNAIYMHPDSYFVDSYADAGLGSTIEIDVPRLIKDGLLKVGQLGREVGFSEGEAVEALASGFEDYEYTSGVGEIDGADRDTIVIFEDIPPEYLSVNGEPLSKHAEHDQKTHGRRKTAGSSKGPASAEDFQSVLMSAQIRAAMEERPKALSKWQGPETFDERLTRCYELSWQTLNKIGGGGEGHQLVHGSIHGPDSSVGRIPHAWVELADGTIFDPVLDLWFSPDEWERGFSAEAAIKYDFDEYGRQSAANMNMGPWHDAPYGNDWYAERGSDA
jgi:hypothetical protein